MEALFALFAAFLLIAAFGVLGVGMVLAVAITVKVVVLGLFFLVKTAVWTLVQTLLLPGRAVGFLLGRPGPAPRPPGMPDATTRGIAGLCDNAACACRNPSHARFCRRCGMRLTGRSA